MSSPPVPPSLPVGKRTRRVVLLSFWAVFLVLGVPLWWHTTALERKRLPAERIHQLAHEERTRAPGHAVGRVVKYSPEYKLVFSLLNENASSPEPVLGWDIDHLLRRHLKPLLTSLEPLHNFTIESQVQYYAPLAVDLQTTDHEPGAWVQEDDVKAFVNNAQWNLAAGTTLDPVLHFILYVPSAEHRPLSIRSSNQDDSTTSFITPQRGGLVILNPPPSASPPSFDSAFSTFSQQLGLLLGLPATSATVTPNERHQIVSRLISDRLEESLLDASQTLTTLFRSITTPDGQQAANVSVTATVQSRVELALDLLDSARACRATPACTISTELSLVSRAQHLANRAYFDPSLLPMLYFPDEHKYAVYTPLFGPVSVPLVVGLIKELKEWRARRKKKDRVAPEEPARTREGGDEAKDKLA
ncbi:hypothetical protein JCM11491_002930 [Sporobolomyces phaffii]